VQSASIRRQSILLDLRLAGNRITTVISAKPETLTKYFLKIGHFVGECGQNNINVVSTSTKFSAATAGIGSLFAIVCCCQNTN